MISFVSRRHSTYLDVGEDIYVPEIASGWRHLAAGAVAGAVSRTCTAPLGTASFFIYLFIRLNLI